MGVVNNRLRHLILASEIVEVIDMILGFWAYQGRVQPIRYLLKYVNFSYTEKLYFEHDDWEKVDKAAFGENAKLPYLKVDDETIVYGEVEILDHLGEKFGL